MYATQIIKNAEQAEGKKINIKNFVENNNLSGGKIYPTNELFLNEVVVPAYQDAMQNRKREHFFVNCRLSQEAKKKLKGVEDLFPIQLSDKGIKINLRQLPAIGSSSLTT